MPTIHKVQGDNGINYKYQEPTKNKKGGTEGIMYLKLDKKTGETKLKNADGLAGYLKMKFRGYSRANENQIKSYLNTRFKDLNTETYTKNISHYDDSKYEKKMVVSAQKFEEAISNLDKNKWDSSLLSAVGTPDK